VLEKLIQHLLAAHPLDDGQVRLAVDGLVAAAVSVELKADFLTALAHKGETPGEIAAFARALREKSVPPPIAAETRSEAILDIVGTGGDRLGTINISSTAALLCAAAGVTVAKHGNRAVTSQSGSADVLETLGVKIDLSPEAAARSLREHGFAFFFAPLYHPAFQQIGPARRRCAERGQRTIFNLLGPLLNPARPSAMLLGVPRPELCEVLAQVLPALGVRRAMVVCGETGNPNPEAGNYLDELSTLGRNTIAEFDPERGLRVTTPLPDSFPLQPASLNDLRGGDRNANAKTVREILSGRERGPQRDAVLLNAAAGLYLAGKASTLREGWDLAGGTIDSGRAEAKLAELTR